MLLGFKKEEICILGIDSIPRLRNAEGCCVFLDTSDHTCKVYENRPKGCEIYPVNCDEDGNLLVDGFCKRKETVSKHELRRKGMALRYHLHAIDEEAKNRRKESK